MPNKKHLPLDLLHPPGLGFGRGAGGRGDVPGREVGPWRRLRVAWVGPLLVVGGHRRVVEVRGRLGVIVVAGWRPVLGRGRRGDVAWLGGAAVVLARGEIAGRRGARRAVAGPGAVVAVHRGQRWSFSGDEQTKTNAINQRNQITGHGCSLRVKCFTANGPEARLTWLRTCRSRGIHPLVRSRCQTFCSPEGILCALCIK